MYKKIIIQNENEDPVSIVLGLKTKTITTKTKTKPIIRGFTKQKNWRFFLFSFVWNVNPKKICAFTITVSEEYFLLLLFFNNEVLDFSLPKTSCW